MNNYLIDIAHKIGLDKSIAYSSGARIVQGITGVGSVFFITTFLTGVEQGFYYTFGSILALQVFFELGLTGIMTQYVAHEVSHLQLNDAFQYEGEELYKSRLASLIHFCFKWYTIMAILVFVFLMIVGLIYFDRYGSSHADVSWRFPWVLICIGTAIKLFQSPFTSIYMGLGKVKEMSKIGFWQQVILPIATWTGLACGLKLYIIGIGYILSVLLWQMYVWNTRLVQIVINLWKTKITETVSYMKEIFPFQWRIALSWVSGYFIFQLFNPVLFATEGAVVAGQMGMTLQALNAIQAFSMSWINTKIPLYSHLIALKNFVQLDIVFNRTLHQMAFVCFILCFVFLGIIGLLNITQFRLNDNMLAERFLPYVPIVLMMIPMCLQQYVYSWATYLRCHKQEPFLWNSIVCGIACCFSTFTLGHLYGLYGVTIGYCIVSILLFPWGYWIYKTKKMEWHYAKS